VQADATPVRRAKSRGASPRPPRARRRHAVCLECHERVSPPAGSCWASGPNAGASLALRRTTAFRPKHASHGCRRRQRHPGGRSTRSRSAPFTLGMQEPVELVGVADAHGGLQRPLLGEHHPLPGGVTHPAKRIRRRSGCERTPVGAPSSRARSQAWPAPTARIGARIPASSPAARRSNKRSTRATIPWARVSAHAARNVSTASLTRAESCSRASPRNPSARLSRSS
jgi:hypothetical protein